MSFLDDLENNLKSLESHEEGAADAESQQRERERRRTTALAVAPYAEELKKGPYTAELLKQTARVGHEFRTKIQIAWLGAALRLEARGRRLELRPSAKGIDAVYIEQGEEAQVEPLDLKGSPESLLRAWMQAAPPPPPLPADLSDIID